MTLRLSTGLRNANVGPLGFQGAFNRGFILIFGAAQAVNADAAAPGAILGIAAANSGTPTYETRATGTITLTGGASGSINTVTVGTFNIIPDGAVPFNTSLNQTASDLCDAINRNGYYTATVSGAVVTISPRAGAGAAHNTYVVTATLTTITATYANMASGVAVANGLVLGPAGYDSARTAVAGQISKPITQQWSFIGLLAGTAQSFRFIESKGDSGLLVSAAPWPCRLDGSIAVSGGDASMGNPVVAVGLPNTIDGFDWTELAS